MRTFSPYLEGAYTSLASCGSHDNLWLFPVFYIGNQYQGHGNVKMLVMAMGANKELMYGSS